MLEVYCANRHPQKSQWLQVFPRLCFVSDASQQEGAIISSCRQGGELPVNIRFSLSLQKEGTVRSCALALKAPSGYGANSSAHFIDQSDLDDCGSPQR